MNCANHPEAAAAAFCQNCGKPLCTECVRSVSGTIFCEQCLAARAGVGPAAGGMPPGAMPPGAMPPGVIPPGVIPPPPGANPALATLLGFIPGVGAMYNGQYIKAIVHVLVFVVLVAIAGSHGIFGIFIGAWVLYQVFDANQTAKARRDGLPLPDPFGLNELSVRMGGGHAAPYAAQPAAWQPPVPPVPPVPPAPGAPFSGSSAGPEAGWTPVAGFTPNPYGGAPYGQAPYGAPPFTPGNPGPNVAGGPIPRVPPDVELEAARREPIGAIVLIGLGMLFLFNTLGFFSFDWVDHGWPVLIIAIGIWLFVRRARFAARFTPHPVPPPHVNDSSKGSSASSSASDFGGGSK